MLTDYVMEFLAVVAFLHGRDGAMLRDGHLFVKKEALLRLLDKNRYDTAMNKLTVWRGLQWIDCDRERFTRRVQINSQQVTAIKIRLSVWELLQQLTKTE